MLPDRGDNLLVFNIRSPRFGKPVTVYYLMLAPIVDAAETLHPGSIVLLYVPWINGNDHVIKDLLASQSAYLIVELFSEIQIIQISR
jgi:hypothetical protein